MSVGSSAETDSFFQNQTSELHHLLLSRRTEWRKAKPCSERSSRTRGFKTRPSSSSWTKRISWRRRSSAPTWPTTSPSSTVGCHGYVMLSLGPHCAAMWLECRHRLRDLERFTVLEWSGRFFHCFNVDQLLVCRGRPPHPLAIQTPHQPTASLSCDTCFAPLL